LSLSSHGRAIANCIMNR